MENLKGKMICSPKICSLCLKHFQTQTPTAVALSRARLNARNGSRTAKRVFSEILYTKASLKFVTALQLRIKSNRHYRHCM